MKKTDEQNRRKEPRHREQLPLRIQGFDFYGQFFVEIIITNNISLSGACISLKHQVKVGQQFQLFTCGNLIPNQTTAKASWVQRQGESWIVGLHFAHSNKFWKNAGELFNQLLLNQSLPHPLHCC